MSTETKNKIVPQLRFLDFKNDSEWKLEPLEEIYSFKSSNSFSRDDLNYENGTVKNIHYGDIHTKFSTLFDILKEKVPFINPSISINDISQESYCKEGDIIFADASEDLKDVGKSIEVVNLNNEKLLSGMHTILVRQKEPKLVVGFGGHLFMTNGIRTQIQRESQGTKVLGISGTRISRVKIYYPKNKIEQQKIASCLSSLDENINAQTEKLEALQAHKKGLMQRLFPAEGETVPKLRFEGFNGEWKENKLGNLVDIRSGFSPSNYTLASGGKYPFLKVEDLNNCEKYQTTSREYSNDKDNIIPEKSVIFPKRGAAILLNKVRINVHEVLMDTNLMAITPNDRVEVEFLYYKIVSEGLYKIADTSTIPQINNKHVLPYDVFIPPDREKKEQQKIAECLSSLDELITAQREKIETLKAHKKGLMQGLFPNNR